MESGMSSRPREKGLGMGLEYVKVSADFQSHSGIRGGLRTLLLGACRHITN